MSNQEIEHTPQPSQFTMDMHSGSPHTHFTTEAIEKLVGTTTTFNMAGSKFPAKVVAAEPGYDPTIARITVEVQLTAGLERGLNSAVSGLTGEWKL